MNKLKNPLPEHLWDETYRGIRFYKNQKGLWFFDGPPRRGHWCRYFTREEELLLMHCIANPHAPKLPIEQQAWVMRTGIERMLRGQIMWTGDLRQPR